MKILPLSRGFETVMDDEDYERLHALTWYAKFAGSRVYAFRSLNRGRSPMPMHREILQPPPGLVADHINGDTLDNRRCNLRVATPAQNTYNSAPRCGRKWKGVYRRTPGCVQAEITARSTHYHLGCYKTQIHAAYAYDLAARVLFGEFARLNLDGEPIITMDAEELSALFIEAESDGNTRITLVSYIGSKFHHRVIEAKKWIEQQQ